MAQQFVMAGVMGWPVAHSRSPVIHNHWIRQYGLNGSYGLFPVRPERLEAALRGLSALGMAGCNITLPHKVQAMQWVDHVDPLGQRMGAINLVVVQADGALHGFNTDGYGFIQSLRDAKPDWRPEAGPIVVLGGGGAARAIVLSLIDAGATSIRLINRTRSKAQALADEFGPAITVCDWSERHDALAGAAMLVNSTDQGMHGKTDLDLRLDALPTDALVCDAIYIPLETSLLASARARGNLTVNGLGMLLNQARPAFKAWFGVDPEVTPVLREAVIATF
ncbi:MAG: shikimate dehydrogenase [Betaproteobacteria bacterium]|nr:shikimate dehydrogenase [Betaproteobacteria bacterium]